MRAFAGINPPHAVRAKDGSSKTLISGCCAAPVGLDENHQHAKREGCRCTIRRKPSCQRSFGPVRRCSTKPHTAKTGVTTCTHQTMLRLAADLTSKNSRPSSRTRETGKQDGDRREKRRAPKPFRVGRRSVSGIAPVHKTKEDKWHNKYQPERQVP